MEINFKTGVYNKILNALNSIHNVSDIKKDTTENLEFSCLICGGIHMSFVLRKKVDLLVLKAEATIPDSDEDKILELGSEIIEESNIRFTSYEDTIVFQLVLPLVDAEGVDGQKLIFNETLSFVHLMCKYKDRLGCNHVSLSEEMDFTKDAEDDPYGFNSFSEIEDDTTQVSEPTPALEEIIGEDENFGTQLPFVDSDIEEDVFENDTKDNGDVSNSEDEDSVFNLNLNKDSTSETVADTTEAEENIFDNTSTKVTVEEDDITERLKVLEEKKKNRKEKRNKQKNKNKNQQLAETEHKEELDIYGDFLKDSSTSDDSSLQPENNTGIDGKDDNRKGEEINMVNYERAPEVVEQMKHLYAEVDQIFARKKEQFDYREKTLDEYAARLDRKEEELRIRTERLEENYKEKQSELEKKELAFETQKHELDFQWEKLHMEQEMIEGQKKDLEESKTVFEKMKAMESESSNQQTINDLQAQLDKKSEEIKELQTTIDSNKISFEEEKLSLQKEAETLRTEINGEEVQGLKDEIADLQDDLKDLTAESEEKDKIIQLLQAKQSESKKTIADMQSEIATDKQTIKELEKKSKEIVPVQVHDNSDELDKAMMRIKMLEKQLQDANNNTVPSANIEDAPEYIRLKQELEKANADLKKADEAYEKEKKAKEEALADGNNNTIQDTNKKAVKIKEELAQIGVEVAPVASASELILSGSKDDVSVIVNVEAGMLYMEKTVKRPIKYKPQFEQWNIEDIRVSYLHNDKNRTIICKYAYNDVSAAVMETLEKFKPLD